MKDLVKELADEYEYEDVITDLFDRENLNIAVNIHIIDFEKPDPSIGNMYAEWSHEWKEKTNVVVPYKKWFDYVKDIKSDMEDIVIAKLAYQKFINHSIKDVETTFDKKYYGTCTLTLKKIGLNGLEFELDNILICNESLARFDKEHVDRKWYHG